MLASRAPSTASKQESMHGEGSKSRSTASKQAQQASKHLAQQASHAAQTAERGAAPRGGDGEGRREQDGGSSCGACRRPQPRRSESDQLRATQGSAGRLLLPPRATVPRRRPDELRAAGKIAGRRTCQPAVVRAARCARQPEPAAGARGCRGWRARPPAARPAAWSCWTARPSPARTPLLGSRAVPLRRQER